MREKGRKSECILTSGERPLPTCCTRRTRRSAPPRWRKNSPSRAIALLRSSGEEILATPRGYVTPKEARGILRRVAVKHTPQEMEAELNAIVDNGCTVIDVIVDHPIYGQLTGPLQISNRYEVSQFIERCKKAEPLSSLTDGIHLHTLSCPDEAAFERTKSALRALRVLLEENGD